MNPIEEIKLRLQKYPTAIIEIKDNEVVVLPADDQGFVVSLIDNNPGYSLAFDAWHEEYEDAEMALDAFAFGLSEDCRLKVSYRGSYAHAWTVEEKDEAGNWSECEWVGPSTTGLMVFPFWSKQRIVYLQNHLLKSD